MLATIRTCSVIEKVTAGNPAVSDKGLSADQKLKVLQLTVRNIISA